ncbi:MAG TPA: hypothetical protein VM120_14665 [Bryobacteraceae bacterium]|nr:hypothetical protein [Bryobacteraceae bacterium]
MLSDPFVAVDEVLERRDPAAALDYLIARFQLERNYPLLFEARLMRKRLDLGLPLIQAQSASDYPPESREAYEKAMMDAAREAGQFFLAEGKIDRAWPYFRAIGDIAPVRSAIEIAQPGEDVEGVIQIAFQEGVHPVKGLELILARYGMCRAITSFGMYAVEEGRQECIHLLAKSLHTELMANIQRAVEAREGQPADAANIAGLIEGRDWLFGEYDYYVDTSHLMSVIQYCPEAARSDTLLLIRDLCAYGKRLSAQFHSQSHPPFEDPFTDYGMYAEALLGENVDAAVQHFQEKVKASDPEEVGTMPAEVLVKLLVRLERYQEALDVSVAHLTNAHESSCPTALQLCHMAGDHQRLRQLAREKGDLLSYAAATLQTP